VLKSERGDRGGVQGVERAGRARLAAPAGGGHPQRMPVRYEHHVTVGEVLVGALEDPVEAGADLLR